MFLFEGALRPNQYVVRAEPVKSVCFDRGRGLEGRGLLREKRGDPCPLVRVAQGWGLRAIRGHLVHSRRPDLRLGCRILQE